VQLEVGRRAYVLVLTGSVIVGSETLVQGDGARLNGALLLSGHDAWVLLIETKA
jgi:hypothetical protein